MSKISLTNEKELFFFHIIRGEIIIYCPRASTEAKYYQTLPRHNSDRRAAAEDFTKEIDKNLLSLLNRDSRISYLVSLIYKIQDELAIISEELRNWTSDEERGYKMFVYDEHDVKTDVSYTVHANTVFRHIHGGEVLLQLIIDFIASRYKADGSAGNSLTEMEMRQFFSKHGVTDVKSTEVVPEIEKLPTFKDLIRQELLELLSKIEDKMPTKVENWRIGKNKIECAAFCELLFEKKYFKGKTTRIKSSNSFSLSRYGLDIKIQLQKSNEDDRKTHKTKLAYLFR